jgi:hypothetical protein
MYQDKPQSRFNKLVSRRSAGSRATSRR